MMEPHISMISLGVNDLEASITFYRDGLGLPMLESPPGVAFFNLNGTWLGLSNKQDLIKDSTVTSVANGYSGINLAHNVSSEEEVSVILNLAVQAGATLVKAAQKAEWGGFHGYFQDLDGHLWEIAYNPFMWIGPKG